MDKDLARNLTLTPQQRVEEHQKALNLVVAIEKAKKEKKDARPKPTSQNLTS